MARFLIVASLLISTLANFVELSAAWNTEHRIIFDDFVGALQHELHAPEVSKSAPPAVRV